MIHIGDCLEVMAGMEAESVQCCVTSPPYWGLRDYGHDGQIGLESTLEAYVNRMVEVFRQVRRILKKDGTLWLNLGDSYAASRNGSAMPAETLAGGVSGRGDKVAKRGRASGYTPHRDPAAHGLKHKDLVGIPWRVAFALQADGWYLRQDIIWHKPNPMPESVRDRCTKAHEYIFLMSKSAKYFYDADAISEKSVCIGKQQANKKYTTDNSWYQIKQITHQELQSYTTGETKNRRSVWTVSAQPFKGSHFATFPSNLIEPCIKAGSREGDTVFDPFFGAGTTGLVASKLDRKYIGIELNPEYAAIAQARIDAAKQREPLFL